jgi:hypothetical protein
MAEVAGNKVAECLPKTLLKMLDTLCEHEVKTWNIYSDRFGISVRIRFDIGEKVAGSDVYMQGTDQARQQHNTAYTRKSPSQHRRDTERKILRAKKRKMEDVDRTEENSETENERKNEIKDRSIYQLDTPLEISCEPPVEDTLVLSPLSPIKLKFLQNELKCKTELGNVMVMEEDTYYDTNVQFVNEIVPPKCPNCYESVMKWDHVCDSKSSDTIEDDTANVSKPVSPPHYNDDSMTLSDLMRKLMKEAKKKPK